MARAAAPSRRFDVSIFHEFAPPPAGGGHQFLRALKREWERRGLRVEVNSVSRTTRACLLNSFNFDAARFRFLRRADCRTIHRVDGPLAVYRGFDDGTDRRIAEWNRNFAQGTVMQSRFSLQAHEKLGLAFREPVVIPNAADPEIFFPPEQRSDPKGRKLRAISASWSDNPNKGAEIYEWLDRNLDFGRLEYTFVGRLPSGLKNIQVLPPMPSRELADLLRDHDVYLTASRNDPCSNSLIEALSCGLPAIYLDSGGHPEIAGEAGLAFRVAEDVPALLERMATEIGDFREKIRVPRIAEVAERYLAALGLAEEVSR
jgi:glycosyltransferase involved in cell wall biosynthesis